MIDAGDCRRAACMHNQEALQLLAQGPTQLHGSLSVRACCTCLPPVCRLHHHLARALLRHVLVNEGRTGLGGEERRGLRERPRAGVGDRE